MKTDKMMRKKMMNRNKFQFNEEDVLPPAFLSSRISAQSRLARKADDSPSYNPTAVPAGRIDLALNMKQNTKTQSSVIPPENYWDALI